MGLARREAPRWKRRFEHVLWDMPEKNAYSHGADALQDLLVGGGDARLLVQRENRGPRAELAVME
jgi:hypothetical protein